MALSTNYGWSEPDDTSLVKDGALAMRTLGNAIDASVWNVGFGQAGKNKFINGNFEIWQRGTSFSIGAGSSVYTADRWKVEGGTAACTVTRQSFTVGQTDVPQNPTFFARITFSATGSAGTQLISQWIENAALFSGQQITWSFYAKVSTGTQVLEPQYVQRFGTGGSGAVAGSMGNATLTTSWQRFSFTTTLPSVTGKTITSDSALQMRLMATPAIVNYDFANFQIEYGSKTTPFQTASGGSIQGELAMCQRYYVRTTANGNLSRFAIGMADSTTTTALIYNSPVSMRIVPTIDFGSLQIHEPGNNVFNLSALTISSISNTTQFTLATSGSTGLTLYRPDFLIGTSSSAYLAFSAEL